MGLVHSSEGGNDEAYTKLRERTLQLTMADFLKQGAGHSVNWMEHNSVTEDTTLDALVDVLSKTPGGACMVVRAGSMEPVACIDLFTCVKYILMLYEGATTYQPYTVIRTYNDFWVGFDRFVEQRLREVPSVLAGEIVQRGASAFFSVSVKEILAIEGIRTYSRVTQPYESIPVTTSVAGTLPLWIKGYTNVLLKTPTGYAFVSEADLVKSLFTGLMDNNLHGAGSVRFRKLGFNRRLLYHVERGTRALQAFRLMSDRGIQAVPVTSRFHNNVEHEHHRYLVGEVSLGQLRLLTRGNFGALMGTVGQYLDALGEQPAPLTIDKRGTLGQLLELMYNDPARRTHVWVVNRHNRLKSVVSLMDILKALNLKMQSE